ncbi:GroES-like protein [Polychaeton citri CBS 116435]|uniref:GroES-like protein n=1 Tax=Polychaeton citri CBS 116435 TaxID=1314669 RepID=A0A9P4Q735_9PEZI|nr:GroES-like protein [Polychaeton citri CBS 116435]
MADITKRGSTTFNLDQPNPALFTNEKHETYLGNSPPLTPGPKDCVVHVRSNGICGSDAHFWKEGRIGSLLVTCDYVLGHEGAGEVVWAGSAVEHLKPGDRVAIEPGIPCGECYQDSIGNYNLCHDVKFSGAPPYNGSIRRYHLHPASFLHKIPDQLSSTDGALLEPLSVVLHGFERSPLRLGESTVICGAGPIGLIALAIAKASGAAPLLIFDIDQARLDFAKKFVPECITFQVQPSQRPEANADAINKTINDFIGQQPRVVYECTGVQSSIITASHIPRPGGEVMVIGVGKPIMNELPFMHMSMAEVDLKFINRYNHSWPVAIRLLAHKVLDLRQLVTHRFPLEKAVDAMEASVDRSIGGIKIHIEDQEDVRESRTVVPKPRL